MSSSATELEPEGEAKRPSRERFLAAAFARPVDRPPVWLMRQAGRYLPEYREVRKRLKFLELCADVPSAVEVSMQPFRRFGMDGVILFSDILIPLPPMGIPVELDEGGPRLPQPTRSADDVARLHGFDPNRETAFVPAIHRALRAEVGGRAATIGFCGAPFTLATYAIEGGSSKSFVNVKTLLHREPRVVERLLNLLADACGIYLAAQIEAGADVVQVFDTWAGELSREDYDRFAAPATERLLSHLPRRGEVPVILFASGSAHLIESLAKSQADVLSIDWKLPLSEARKRAPGKSLQGNVDPGLLLGDKAAVAQAVRRARQVAGPLGHIFNLGHGILPPTPPENVQAFVAAAREEINRNDSDLQRPIQ